MGLDDLRCCSAALLALGCSGSMELTLQLEGPSVVEVHRLGPVPSPDVRLSDGSVPDGIEWEISRPAVARFGHRGFQALGHGRTDVIGHWEGQQVSWVLVVDPSLRLHFDRPPAHLVIGETVPLVVLVNGEPTGQAELTWSSSVPTVLGIDRGRATGLAPGTSYVTVEREGSRAMVELTVLQP